VGRLAALACRCGRVNGTRARPQRLSPLDVSNLRAEDHGMPMHVAALAILAGAPLSDATGRLRLADIQRCLELRTGGVPRLRQVLTAPRWFGPPRWAGAPGFDIRDHVRTHAVPPPGDEDALLAACAALNEPPLDRARPLWEMWLLTGLADGTVGLLIRLHHAVADGIAALALIGGLLDPGPQASAPPPALSPAPAALPAPASSPAPAALPPPAGVPAPARVPAPAGHPGRARRGHWAPLRQARQLLRERAAPRVSINTPAGPHRRLLLVRADLGQVKAAARAHGATVNDVVLAAVAAGARELLANRGELSMGLELKASVAASMRGGGDQAGGNRVGIMLAPLPVAEPDPGARLARIAKVMARRKQLPPYQPSSRFGQRWMVAMMDRQRLVNLFTSNLPGPAAPVYLAGARVREMFQIGVVQGNVTLAVGVLSYAGQLNVTVLADPRAVPDVAVFAGALAGSLVPAPAGPALAAGRAASG
jgi:diacylglycerol O-acyltransferase / wax synthase